jgi:hypothetical protein
MGHFPDPGGFLDLVLELLRIVFGLLLIFVLPGVALIKWMFPRPGELDQEYNGIYILALGMTTSVCLTILVGFILGSIKPDNGTGYFDAPYIIGSLVTITVVFFILGWWRGAYPWLGLIHPSLARFPMPAEAPRTTKRHDDLVARIEELTKEHDRLKREVKDLLKRERTHERKMADHYKDRRVEAEKELERVRVELDTAKEKQSKLIYEAKEREDEKRRRRERRREKREEKPKGGPLSKVEKDKEVEEEEEKGEEEELEEEQSDDR